MLHKHSHFLLYNTLLYTPRISFITNSVKIYQKVDMSQEMRIIFKSMIILKLREGRIYTKNDSEFESILESNCVQFFSQNPYTIENFPYLSPCKALVPDDILTPFRSGLKIYVKWWGGGCSPPPPSKHPKSL